MLTIITCVFSGINSIILEYNDKRENNFKWQYKQYLEINTWVKYKNKPSIKNYLENSRPM